MNDAPQDDWLQAARMEALEAEVRRLQTIEDALTASQAEIGRLRMARRSDSALTDALDVWNDQLEDENKQLKAQLAASQSEVERLTALVDDLHVTVYEQQNEIDDPAKDVEITRLREVLALLVDPDEEMSFRDCEYSDGCNYCGDTRSTSRGSGVDFVRTFYHASDCPVTLARALLTPPAATEEK